MGKIFKEYWKISLLGILTSLGVAYGISEFLPLQKGFCITFASLTWIFFIYKSFIQEKNENEDLINLENVVNALDVQIIEQDQVIKYYEDILDTQIVRLKCNCGEPLFDGILTDPANMIECQNCKNSYKVSVNYETIQISNPQDFESVESIIGEV